MSMMKRRKKGAPMERITPISTPDLPSPLVKFAFKPQEEANSLQSMNVAKTEIVLPEKIIEQTVELLPKSGKVFDSLSQIEIPKSKPKFTLFNIPKAQEEPDAQEEPRKEEAAVEQTNDNKDGMKQILNYNKPLGFGIFRTFEYLRRNGLLYQLKGQEQSIIEYRDEFGNVTTDSHAAFKAQSHRFSGRAPGAKRMEKLKAKSIAMKRISFQESGDTPLQAGKALRETLAQTGKACLELTGANKSVIPYIPEEAIVDKAIEKKKRRLKKVKKLKVIARCGHKNEMIDKIEAKKTREGAYVE